MSIATERLVNGLLKGFRGSLSPGEVRAMLSQDVEIVAPHSRARLQDLWPAIWALASVLERQLFGRVFIRCGIARALPAPSRLGPRCQFTDSKSTVSLSIKLGVCADNAHPNQLVGDARAGAIAIGELLDVDLVSASPIECFVLAGYLGYAALARLVGIPDSGKEYTRPVLRLLCDHDALAHALDQADGLTSIGLGQIGQAYLALLYFLYKGTLAGRRITLIDDDNFQSENGRTQLLLEEGGNWIGKEKVAYIQHVLKEWGANVQAVPKKIDWTWRRELDHPSIALLGLHDLEGRRMASAAGFERLIEAGVGTNLLKPRITWHTFPGDSAIGRRLFPEQATSMQDESIDAVWADELRSTPGRCGWVEFLGVSSTAPCLGAAAAAFALAELVNRAEVVSGAALLWSQCLPILRKPGY